jgi:endonuclease YncB( thermonuclease family)
MMPKRAFVAVTAAVAAALAQVALIGPDGATQAAPVAGQAKVIDGDSLEIGMTQIRLYGIDAFEGKQSCGAGGGEWDCGEAAADKLRSLVGSRPVTCDGRDVDDYGRTVAVCHSGETDLGAELVRAGLALAYRRFSDDYVDEEDDARFARRGAWAGDFEQPWNERNGARRASQPAASAEPSGSRCADPRIKGNVNRGGERIYHVPGSQSYQDTVIDPSDGERWFCSEEEARNAGWRPPRRR